MRLGGESPDGSVDAASYLSSAADTPGGHVSYMLGSSPTLLAGGTRPASWAMWTRFWNPGQDAQSPHFPIPGHRLSRVAQIETACYGVKTSFFLVIDLLRDFQQVIVPDAVRAEIARHRPSALRRRALTLTRAASVPDPEPQLLELTQALLLGAGEYGAENGC